MIRTVVHFIDSEIYGGCEEVVLTLLTGIDRQHWRPVLFHHDAAGISPLLDEIKRQGISCRSVPRINGRNILSTLPYFIRALRAEAPSIFHAHLNWPLACWHEMIAAKISRVPLVVATAHLFSPTSGIRARMRRGSHAAMIDRYIAVSGAIKDDLGEYLRIPESKIQVIQNGIRSALFSLPPDPSLRVGLTEGKDRPIILTPARLHSQKGHIHLLEAARHLPDALFLLVGDGPERGHLEEYAKRLGIQGRVRFLGHRQDIPRLLAICDLFVLPSIYEGLPLTVLEAMAAGKPVIATAIRGTDEAVVHGVTGLLVPPGNPTELAAAIRALLSDRGLAARFGQSGRERVISHFSSDRMVSEVTTLYNELIAPAG